MIIAIISLHKTNLLGLSNNKNACNSKKLFSFLKTSRQDQQGAPSLKQDSTLITDIKTKANLHNQQFNSVFIP